MLTLSALFTLESFSQTRNTITMDVIGNIKIESLAEDLSQLCTKQKWLMSRIHTVKKQIKPHMFSKSSQLLVAITPTYRSGFKVQPLRMICL